MARSTRSELTSTDLNRSTQLHDAFVGHAYERHDFVLIGCKETGTVSARRVASSQQMCSDAAVHTAVRELCDLVRCVCSQSVQTRSIWRDTVRETN